MPELVIALCQLPAAGLDARANLSRGLAACAEAAANGADVVVFPELWQIGYTSCPEDGTDRAAWQARALDLGDPWEMAFGEAARDLNVAVLITFLERWAGAPRNTAVLFDRRGEAVLRYAKVHTCDFSMEAALTPGDGFETAEIETRAGPVRIGVMICYDREFPESARELMLAGAEVILVPNACHMTEDRLGQLRARAFENMTAIALANYPAPAHGGRSCAFDGVAFRPDGTPRDHQLLLAGAEEGLHYARLDLDLLRRYRLSEGWGDAYRKPYAYQRLGATGPPSAVFRRGDARRFPAASFDASADGVGGGESAPGRPAGERPT
ncbi:MAG: carbon-nitrogen hydrolase family protein [Candidatus Dormibacteria bacterium]